MFVALIKASRNQVLLLDRVLSQPLKDCASLWSPFTASSFFKFGDNNPHTATVKSCKRGDGSTAQVDAVDGPHPSTSGIELSHEEKHEQNALQRE